jgi:MFS family permease
VLRHRDVRGVVPWGFAGRLPLFMVPLGLVLYVAGHHGGYVRAGLLTALYTAGGATLGIVAGRLVDRRGQAVVLLATGIMYPLSIIGLVLSVTRAWPLACVLAVIAGGVVPPIGSSVQSLWASLPLGEDDRSVMYALEAVFNEALAISGPLLLTLLTVIASAGAALVVGGVLGGVGAVGLAATRSSRGWRGSAGGGSWLGPLRSGGLLALLGVVAVGSVAMGLEYNLAVPAFAIQHGDPSAAGWLFACAGVGSGLGGFWYGTRRFGLAEHRQYLVLLLGVAAGLALPALAPGLWVLALTLIVGGLAAAPMIGLEYGLVQRSSPEGTLTEAFTWVLVAGAAGGAVGVQAGGFVVPALGLRWSFAIAGLIGLASVAIALAFRRRLAQLSTPVS